MQFWWSINVFLLSKFPNMVRLKIKKTERFSVFCKTIIFVWKCLKMAPKKMLQRRPILKQTRVFVRTLNVFVICKTFWHLNSQMKWKKNFNCLVKNDSHLSVLRLVINFFPFKSSPPLYLLPSATSQLKQPRKTNFKMFSTSVKSKQSSLTTNFEIKYNVVRKEK